MRAVDTSVAVPALVGWHEAHRACVEAVGPEDRLPAHAALEVYSVLTRLPPRLRLDPRAAASVLRRRFPPPYLHASAQRRDGLPDLLAEAGVRGGAAFDALVGLTAGEHGVPLLSRDARARPTYLALGVDVQEVEDGRPPQGA